MAYINGNQLYFGVANSGVNVVQTTGQSTSDIMSQKAVTDNLNDITDNGKKYNTNKTSNNLLENAIRTEGYYIKNDGTSAASANFAYYTITSGFTGKYIIGMTECRGTLPVFAFYDNTDTFIASTYTLPTANCKTREKTISGHKYVSCISVIPDNTAIIKFNDYSDAYWNTIDGDKNGRFVGQKNAFYNNTFIPSTGAVNKSYYSANNSLDTDYLYDISTKYTDEPFVINMSKHLSIITGVGFSYGYGSTVSNNVYGTMPLPTDNIYKLSNDGDSTMVLRVVFLNNDYEPIGNSGAGEIYYTDFPDNTAYVSFIIDMYAGGHYINHYVTYKTNDKFIDYRHIKNSPESNKYQGLNGVAFGTSLTIRSETSDGYMDYLPILSEMTWDNQGYSGSKIYGTETTSILNKILNYTHFAGKNVVIIEGFVNDWYGTAPLGTYTDKTNASVCGCLYLAINHIAADVPYANIFVILDHYGRNSGLDCSTSSIRNNLTQYQYYEECAKVCESLGVVAIKEYAISGISQLAPQYLYDNIHCNDLGARQSANTIWSEMMKVTPKVTN